MNRRYWRPLRFLPLFAVLAIACGGEATLAEEAASSKPPVAETTSPRDLETYGEADATCLEWSNGCQVCRRQPEGGWGCSTPGIACVPVAVTCRGR
jgi:hypothetical protein